MLKPGGLMLLGLPVTGQAKGRIEFNAHRVYGWERLAHIASGFELIATVGTTKDYASEGTHGVFILRKPTHEEAPALTANDFSNSIKMPC